MLELLLGKKPIQWKETFKLRVFGLLKVPMILFTRPVVQEVNDQRAIVRIPLCRRTKNHYGSLYFGALAVGADACGGILAMYHMDKAGVQLGLLFKDFHAEFLKRAMGDVSFVCEAGDEVKACIAKAIETGERHNVALPIEARVDGENGPVAKFTLTLSVKKRKR